jgi:hypothetical protein
MVVAPSSVGPEAPEQRCNSRRLRAAIVVALVLILLILAMPIIASGQMLGRAGFDQLNFHERAIRIFAHDWPRLDLKNYLSATTPGYHLVLAAVCRYIASSSLALQIAGQLFSSALVALLAWHCSKRAHPVVAFVVVLAFMLSPHVVLPAIWLQADNAGWLGVLAIFIIMLDRVPNRNSCIAVGAALALLVVFRQSHLWIAAPIVVWVAKSSTSSPATHTVPRTASAWLRAALLTCAIIGPAAAIVLAFAVNWHGLTPPLFRTQYSAPAGAPPINLAAPAFVLAVFGCFAPFFVVSWLPRFIGLCRTRTKLVVVAFVAVLILAIVPNMTYNADQNLGRWDGLWSMAHECDKSLGIVRRLPSIAKHTSIFMLGLTIVGGASLVGLLSRLSCRNAIIIIVALAAFAAAQAVSYQLWQRYTEPLVLMLYALLVCRESESSAAHKESGFLARHPALHAIGPLLLALLLAVFSARKLYRETPQHALSADELMVQLFPNAPKSLTPRVDP